MGLRRASELPSNGFVPPLERIEESQEEEKLVSPSTWDDAGADENSTPFAVDAENKQPLPRANSNLEDNLDFREKDTFNGNGGVQVNETAIAVGLPAAQEAELADDLAMIKTGNCF